MRDNRLNICNAGHNAPVVDGVPNEPTQQLLAYIGGEGGTGKSVVIRAIQSLFKLCNVDHWLRSASYTGTAANNINGTTLSSLLKDNQKSKEDQLTVSFEKMEGLRISLGSIKFMIIDEMSMLSTQWMAKLSARCKQARNSGTTYFSIIFS